MEKIFIFIIFLIIYIINFYITWYNPFNFKFINEKYNNHNKPFDIINDINNNKSDFYESLYHKKIPVILDSRTFFEYNWDKFDIPIFLIKNHIVASNNNIKFNDDNNILLKNFINDNKDISFLSMFHSTNEKLLKKIIYDYFPLPKFLNNIYSKYYNDIIININSNFKTPYFLNNNTYHIFFIVKGEVKIKFLSHDNIKNSNNNFNQFKFYSLDFLSIENIDDETNVNSILLKENSFIILPHNYLYSFEFNNNNTTILSYYYESYLNKILNNYLNLKNKVINSYVNYK